MLLPLRGIANDVGENNCFLNVIIQCLFHLDSFVSRFVGESGRDHRHERDCLFCTLQVSVGEYGNQQCVDGSPYQASLLRKSLSELYKSTLEFQEGVTVRYE